MKVVILAGGMGTRLREETEYRPKPLVQIGDRSVFVTGGTGLLGSWLVEELVGLGTKVTALVRDWVPKPKLYRESWQKEINIVRGCVEDLPLLERIISEYEVNTVFHLAAQTIVGVANRSPLGTFEANIKGTWNVLEACRLVGGVSRIVVASSDKAYGDQEILPYDETTPLQGEHPYDVSKSCADLICRTYYVSYDLPVCITRCGNFYGGGDLNFNRIVPDTIRSTLRNKPVVIRSDGSYIRDYFYVKDGVYSYLHLAEQMERQEIWGEAFNFSNELQITVLQLVQQIIALMGKSDLEPEILNQATNEIKHQYLSAAKARKLLHWQPKYSLAEGLLETINWYKEFLL